MTDRGEVPALRVSALDVAFGDEPGLHGIDLSVERGERLVIVGPSGSGKTSLLRTIAGLAPARAGRIEIDGRDVTELPAEGRGAVYLHQTPLLFPHLSVAENIAFPLRVRRVAPEESAARVAQILEAVRLPGFADRRPHTLSGGQRHRVALARAIVARPALLLLDEPLSALDPTLRDEVRDAILEIQREFGPALVLVSHDLDDAGLVADRVAVLIDRAVAQIATPAELFMRPESLAVARFLGIPNEVPGRADGRGGFVSALGSWASVADGVEGDAVAVFRSDAVRLDPESALLGTVVDRRYTARGIVLVIDVGPVRLQLPARPGEVPSAGERVRVAIDVGQVAVFAAPGRGR